MRKRRGFLAGLIFIILAAQGIMGCGGKKAAFDPKTYVKGVLDTAYKGEYSDYTAQTGVKKSEAEAGRAQFLKNSGLRLAAYFGIAKEENSESSEFENLCKEKLYPAADYEVTEAKETDRGYEVTVKITSATKAFGACAADTEELRETYQKGLARGEAKDKLTQDYREALTDKLEELFSGFTEKVKNSGEEKEVTVVLEKDGENGYVITSDSLAKIQEQMFGF